jgi:hypothetical protein
VFQYPVGTDQKVKSGAKPELAHGYGSLGIKRNLECSGGNKNASYFFDSIVAIVAAEIDIVIGQ